MGMPINYRWFERPSFSALSLKRDTMKWNTTAPVWTWVTVPPVFLILMLGLSLVGSDQRLTLLVATTCMAAVVPVLLFRMYRRDIKERERTESELGQLL